VQEEAEERRAGEGGIRRRRRKVRGMRHGGEERSRRKE
jgi:hypothetical protein